MAATKPSEETTAADVDVVEADAPVAPAEATPVVATTRPRGRKLALIITGAVVAVALIFGGGVAVGLAIPTGGPGFSQQGGPGGFPGGQFGDRPQMPGNGQQNGPGQNGGNGGNGQNGGTGSGSTDDSTDDGA